VSRAERVDAELEALYAQVPDVGCRGLCVDACGPIDGGHRERVRMARAGVRLPTLAEAVRRMASTPDNYECPALVDGRCSTYGARPMVCRIWAASEDLPCPYGCRPVDGRPLLTSAETQHLIDAARKAGTCEEPRSVEEYEAILDRPGARARYQAFIPTPETTRPGTDHHSKRRPT
jgi:Fe-S-cluster containining protein